MLGLGPGKDKTKLVRTGEWGPSEVGRGKGDALKVGDKKAGEPSPGAVHRPTLWSVSPKERNSF